MKKLLKHFGICIIRTKKLNNITHELYLGLAHMSSAYYYFYDNNHIEAGKFARLSLTQFMDTIENIKEYE